MEELGALCREVEIEAQEHAREELALFFTHSLDLQCIAGFDGYFKRLNPAWMVRLGWSLEALRAEPFLDLVHADDRDAMRAEVKRLERGGRTILFESRFRHFDGSYRWLQWNAWQVPGRRRIYATARDVTRQKRLEREVLEIVDNEKARLGRELHDGLCQSLAGIAALSTTLARRLAKGSQATGADAANEITGLLNEAIGESRDLARGLGPLDPRGGDLEAAFEALATRVRKRFRIACSFAPPRTPLGLTQRQELHLYRIAQEAVGNAITHGRGDRITIELRSCDGQGILSVRDDGRGLPGRASDADGIGMHTMTYRARRIRGSLQVRRRRSSGTAVTCTFPLPETAETASVHDGR